MKRIVCLLIALLLSACSTQPIVKEEPTNLRLTTTTSVNDSGLIEYLRPYILEDLNINLEVVSLGSGAAIEAGQRGDADVLLVHSPAAEDTFVQDGYGIKRSTFMYNFFVIVGPNADPAIIKGLSAKDAFLKIYETKSLFVSRGDNSGTHSKEKNIWKSTNLIYDELSLDTSFYVSSGSGMGNTLIMANEKQAYTLTDLATFLSMQDKLDLDVIVSESPDLRNEYSIVVINPEKVENVDSVTALKFEEWMLSEKALGLISEFGKEEYKQALFFTE